MEHLDVDKINQYFLEGKRVLKSDGKMIISTPNKTNRLGINNPYHIKEYTEEELDKILTSHFKYIVYYSLDDKGILNHGVSLKAVNIIAVCSDEEIEDPYKKYLLKKFNKNVDDMNNTEELVSYLISTFQGNVMQDNIDDLTIMMASYNRGSLLKHNLKNGLVFGQQTKVIVDDCSDDGNKKIIKSCIGNYGVESILFNNINIGVAESTEKLINLVNTKYVMGCGDDDNLICLNYDGFKDEFKNLNGSDIIIPRYILNLDEDNNLSVGYDRKEINKVPASEILKLMISSGEMFAFNAGAVFISDEYKRSCAEKVFKVAEDYVTLSRILGNNLQRTIKVSNNYVYVRRISNNTLSRTINKSKLTLNLLSLLVSGYYCCTNNLMSFSDVKEYIQYRGALLSELYGFGIEISDLIINYLNNDITLESFLKKAVKEGDMEDISLEDIPQEIINICTKGRGA